jgi:hypothetical protein
MSSNLISKIRNNNLTAYVHKILKLCSRNKIITIMMIIIIINLKIRA